MRKLLALALLFAGCEKKSPPEPTAPTTSPRAAEPTPPALTMDAVRAECDAAMRRRADVAKAEAACREFLKENPRDPEPWWRLARLHAAVDRHATAMDDARRALEIDGRCVPAAVELILAWLRTEGEHFRDRLLRAVPLSPLGGLLVRRDAAEFLPFPSVELPKNRLQALQPADFAADGSDVDALLLAGLRLAMRIRDSKSQNAALVALADRGSDRPEVYEVASLFVPDGTKRLRFAARALQLNPRSVIALLAKILHAVETSERFDEASADLDRLLEIAPGRSDVWEIRARIGLLLRDGSKETLAAWDRVTKDDSPAALRYGRAAARLWKAVTDGDAAAVDRAIEELGQVGRQPVTHAVAKLIAAVRMPDRYAAYVPEIAKDLQSDLARSLYALAVVAWLDREENPDALKRLGSTDAGSDPDVARRCAEWAVKLGERGPDAKRWFRKAASFYEEAARTDPPRKGEMQKRAAEMLQRAGK